MKDKQERKKDIEDASEVAFQLDIPYEVLDFTLDFQEKIIGKFVRTYEAGGTPNPCIDCNRFMKFDKLLDFAEQCSELASMDKEPKLEGRHMSIFLSPKTAKETKK